MENNNNSKQVVLSIVGIAILVIAVVGVSFAFFTYSRTGEKNNIITTGSITFALEDGDQPVINAKDSFPMKDEETTNAPTTDFKVTGSLPAGASSVTYKVYAIKGDEMTEPANPPAQTEADAETPRTWKRFKDSEISLGLSVSGDTESVVNIVENYKYDAASQKYGSPIDTLEAVDTQDGKNTKGLLLATGTLAGGKSIEHTFTAKMWINSTVTISDTNYSYKYRASDVKKGDSPLANATQEENDNTKLPYQAEGSATDEREVYSDHYYSIKLMVVASDDPSFAG